jgi:prepilin-type N-terminal cleavage/methylation domain-containing protein
MLQSRTLEKQHPMKLTNTPRIKAKSGMTLLELTVVILVLLSLLSILFVGAKAWKVGSDRAANVMNIRNVQQAVRGHAAMNDIVQEETTPVAIAGGSVPKAAIFGAAGDGVGGYLRLPVGIASVTYTTPLEINTATGVLYLQPSSTGAVGATYGPKTGSTADW